MGELKRWLIGFTCAVAVLENNLRLSTLAQTCPIDPKSSAKTADCSGKTLTEIPQDLSEDIDYLVMAFCPPINLAKDAFQKYTKLSRIDISKTVGTDIPDPTADEETFLSVMNLDTVYLQQTRYKTVFRWPSKLKLLMLDNNPMKEFKIDDLEQLVTFGVKGCGLQSLPKIHPMVTLLEIFADDNPFEQLTAEDVARFCMLNKFVMQHEQENDAPPADYCRCSRLKKWMQLLEIGKLFPTSPHLTPKVECSSYKDGPTPTCSYDFEEARDIYIDCLIMHGMVDPYHKPTAWLKPWMIVVGIASFAVLFLLLLVYCIVYYIIKRENMEPDEEDGE